MKRERITNSPRLAGLVKRYHTWPTIREQTVAEHTWHVMRIYQTVFFNPQYETLVNILYHDIGEVQTGDIPFPVKAQNPCLKKQMDGLERDALARMNIGLFGISDEEKLKVKICDLLEMHEYGIEEVVKGNKFALPIVDDTADYIMELLKELPSSRDQDFVLSYMAELRVTWLGGQHDRHTTDS